MKAALLRILFALLIVLPVAGLWGSVPAIEVMIDGSLTTVGEWQNHPANTTYAPDGRPIDVVGDTSNSSSGTGRAKGNSYRVDIDVVLNEAEFYLNFTSTQTLTYYVFVCPVEFGTYNEVYRASETVTGSGPGWYSSGPVAIALDAGYHYIIAVSWNGTVTYYYGVGDSQATSFGAHTHGYATGYDPLPTSFSSLVNDQAIYHQRLTTNVCTPVEESTWGAIKALYQ
jgi:hypothetical protein